MQSKRLLASAVGALMSVPVQAQISHAPVTLEIKSRTPAFGGAPIGDRGPYEQLTGIAHMKIDPTAPANRGIVDLDLAPRDARGLVRYDVDVVILRPRDPAKARGVMLYEVVNRGLKLITMATGGSATGGDAGNAGNTSLMRQGYTIVWSGWQGDIAGAGAMSARVPIATDRGRPITDRVASEIIFDNAEGGRLPLAYPAASLDQAGARLTVRRRAGDPEQLIAPANWRYADERHVTLSRPVGMDAGAIYRFSYVARDPKVMGLGFASVRDLIAFLRHGSAAQGNPLADLASARCERDAAGACANRRGGLFSAVVGFGASQSARYLRDFLWQDFNRDLNGNRVFDGMFAMVPGGRRTFTNMRFSEPGRFALQHENHDVPGFDFPFAYSTLRDPLTGRTDGILSRCTANGTCPKLFHVDTSGEFWQAGASLVGTGGTDRDIPFPDHVRAYMIAGGAHAPGMTSPACEKPANPLRYTPIIQALLVDLVDWTIGRQDPPKSRWPRVADGTLRPLAALAPPDLSEAGVHWPKVLNRPVAPAGTSGWPVFVPQVDADGNDVPGIRMPELAAPTGTYLGWSLRKPGYAAGELCLIYGSYLPFATDEITRGKDPRRSLAERYRGDEREMAIRAATIALRRDRLISDDGTQPTPLSNR